MPCWLCVRGLLLIGVCACVREPVRRVLGTFLDSSIYRIPETQCTASEKVTRKITSRPWARQRIQPAKPTTAGQMGVPGAGEWRNAKRSRLIKFAIAPCTPLHLVVAGNLVLGSPAIPPALSLFSPLTKTWRKKQMPNSQSSVWLRRRRQDPLGLKSP